MAAVIRIKRRLEDEPSDTLILNCKKRKTEADTQDQDAELSTILKFAGTVKNQEDTLSHIKKPTKVELEDQFKKHSTDLSSKLRLQKQEDSKKNRYKVVNCFRSQSANLEETNEPKAEYTIYDIETENHDQISKDSDQNYVYDLYYTTSDDLGELDDYVSMYPYNDVFMYGSVRDNGLKEADSDDDSEDSNAENFWKNDYPDESDMESVTEEDMLQAMKKCDLSDLSSDDGEEGFVYSIDSEGAGFEEDVDDSDVQRYGERYARFKAKHKKNVQTTALDHDLYYGDIDEEEFYY
ncbi:probable RNA polymerase II nuclear localization protein SLC7A6OS [Tribolium castaneum]|uniref:Probable RNA polymerase II nuclear localization protein SLC7A6OS n=1 Tax=Tribolium castaneum TaxID=7070 RepID=D6WKC1_TRICA|nr:PREDICTED: probable RNA polymerase II nuclear localization protein SLC7A6OS isoform X2 [Tribolium castaneum]EFA03974.1 putative RNA polymerase II nuclear localization protein SLC7A6OS-like Protein [Tribolium castaneum]|eukprot:XP_008193258.1 PREDICTED: probable RNA polymerase II nuclear localization protein SLC7A6OS isoform X2 [Tribolium castaneum]